MTHTHSGTTELLEIDRPVYPPFNPEAEQSKDPIEQYEELKAATIRAAEINEMLDDATQTPNLAIMAAQSTFEVTELLRSRKKNPLPGFSRGGVVEHIPRDNELTGLAKVHSMIHDAFYSSCVRTAGQEYQESVPFDIADQTEWQRGKRDYEREAAIQRCSEVCPSYRELQERVYRE